ncbi:MAG: hypothetical protein WC490_05065 [Candidatus Margulisiibacteriota bacterium]
MAPLLERASLPVARTFSFSRGWLSNLGISPSGLSSLRINCVDNRGIAYITPDGRFSPNYESGARLLNWSQNVGLIAGDPQNRVVELPVLGHGIHNAFTGMGNIWRDNWLLRGISSISQWFGQRLPINQQFHASNVIEICQHPTDMSKLLVFERRPSTVSQNPIDTSKYFYRVLPDKMDEATREAFDKILDFGAVTRVRITEDRSVEITYMPPSATSPTTVSLPGSCFADNFGRALLDNPNTGMENSYDVYQRDSYTSSTEVFRPAIGHYGGTLQLCVHRVHAYEIDKPGAIGGVDLSAPDLQILPSSAYSAIEVSLPGSDQPQWIPLFERLGNAEGVNLDLSGVLPTRILSTVDTQNRIGNLGTILFQLRDLYFYGSALYAGFRTEQRYGNHFGLNFFKGLDFSGICAGRSFTEWAGRMFRSPYRNLLETNSPHYSKLMLYGHQVEAPGVGEDHQGRTKAKLEGTDMLVTNDPTTSIMAAEGNAAPSGIGPNENQDCNRYNLSEVLGYVVERFSSMDIIRGGLLKVDQKFTTWGDVMQTMALRYWYKWPFAETLKLLAAPSFLLSAAFLPFLPVDREVFIWAWSALTATSLVNYSLQWKSMGLSPILGLWNYPILERSKIFSYTTTALTQFYDRFQYAKFIMTSAGRGGVVKLSNRVTTAALAGLSGFASAVAVNDVLSGRLTQMDESMYTWAFMVNLVFCSLQAVQLGVASSFLIQASEGKVRQYTLEEYDGTTPSEGAMPADAKILADCISRLRNSKDSLGYDELFEIRAGLLTLARNIGAVDKVGRARLEPDNPYGEVANKIFSAYSATEALICVKASRELAHPSTRDAAFESLKRILEGTEYILDAPEPATRDFVVRNTASRLYRQYRDR